MRTRSTPKALALLLALTLALGLVITPGLLSVPARAARDATVYVSAVEDGRFVTGGDGQAIACVPVLVGGETPAIDDVFAALHTQYYDGEDGYATERTGEGRRVAAFWGAAVARGDCYHNNVPAAGLSEAVADGDTLCFSFSQNAAAGADVYTYFDKTTAAAAVGASLKLTLTAAGESAAPLTGATVTVDGAPAAVTNGYGRVTLTLNQVGVHLISAAAPEDSAIVPPVCVVTVEREKTDDRAVMEALMINIAASDSDNSDDWVVMDMAAYARLGLSGAVTSDAAKQACLDAAIAALRKGEVSDTTYARAILALTAIGVDATQLYPAGGAAFSAVSGLNAAPQSSSAWCAPYTLAAYNQGHYRDTDSHEAILIDAVLDAQEEDGSWSGWGESIQATANMIVGLAFYRDVNPSVSGAIDRALDYLAAVQKEDGSFDAYGSGADSNTAAMVVIALAAVGVDPDNDPRFVRYGVSPLDGLLDFAYADNSGFGYQSGEKGEASSSVTYATELAFRALIAAYQVMTTGGAYNVYDFSGGAVVPGYGTAVPGDTGVSKAPITAPGATFPDLDGRADRAAIEALAQREILNGKDSGLFDPEGDMTRAEFATAIVKALSLEPQITGEFPDVAEDDWFAPYVGAACRSGIVNGTEDGFVPLGPVTRQEAAVMVARAARLCGLDTGLTEGEILDVLAPFGDSAAIGEWARPSVAFCYSAGILNQDGLYVEPTVNIRRCEIAQMLYNLLERAGLL